MRRFQATLLSQNERVFILDSLKEKNRVDGRRPYDVRKLTITFGPVYGVSEVQLGQTRVITKVTSEVVEPMPERPTEGFYVINTVFSPMADPTFKHDMGRSSEAAVELGRIIERSLRESRAIDTEALCIVAGEKVWSVRCDVHIVDNNGNLLDCSSISIITALLHFRRPYTSIVGSTVTVLPYEDREPVPLSIHHIPVCITFGLVNDGGIVVVDPDYKEELIMDGRMTFVFNSHREICGMQKAGGIPIDVEQVLQCARIAAVKAEEIIAIIQLALKHDVERRTNGTTEMETKSTIQKKKEEKAKVAAESDDSEEENTVILTPNNLKSKTKRT